ncbi:succinyldiaminopimelate transaminase [Parahaliea mediterranea]|uniref:Succinyldiaminopimelate transaminase n=1 Tax=Parahaliea mediterranea TaxID=651086 RepID=A0A939DFW1_9GAMM|nr:succinyldiaminopimelate transaminase [Parahaliea mediterranea]MBN7797540.1 succinyldiaminopimelate transaminase [Parahaliea mediterranea]
MNPQLALLQPYPFEKLRELFADIQPSPEHSPIALSIGEPRHPSPPFVLERLAQHLDKLANYPATRGGDQLRGAIAGWLERRFGLRSVDPERQVLPVNGTREALFAFAQTVIEPGRDGAVMSPNPFYQIYEGAALLAGTRPQFIDCTAQTGFAPDFDSVTPEQWRRCQLLYICTPGNPSGAVLSMTTLQKLIALAREHDFIIASDECYSEIYFDEEAPPPGLLQACAAMGEHDFARCVVFHSLSKRSNLPGLRSGFVAGDADILAQFLRYRTYHGCAMPLHHQLASEAAWEDEAHVVDNRRRYRQKFDSVLGILAELGDALPVARPDAGFYLWPATPVADTDFARALLEDYNVTVLPGRYLARDAGRGNPGEGRVRMALVAEHADCEEAARRIVDCVQGL